MSKDLIVKKNPLIESRYKMNSLEMKILLTVVGQVEKDDSDFWTYQVAVKDMNIDYKNIKRACKTLINRSFEVRKGDNWELYSWFSYIGYKHKEGLLECSFDPRLKPYLLQLKDNFTSYTLNQILPMKSVYSIRIYELLKQYEKIGDRTFNLDELQDMLQVPASYRVWRDFNKRVLETAEEEINHHTDLLIEYNPVKTGRKITAVSFRITSSLQEMTLNQYKAHLRANCVNMTLSRTKDQKTGKDIELSISPDGLLYNKLDPNWRINRKRADKIYKTLLDNDISFNADKKAFDYHSK